MDLYDYMNVQRVFQTMAIEWGCQVWMVKQTVQESIDQSWEKALFNSELMSLWNKYFPNGKPTSDEYMSRLGHAYETGEEMPFLLNE